VDLDSLALLLPGGVWFLDAPTRVEIGDSTVRVGALALASGRARGRVSLDGDLPTRGPGNARLQLESFPVAGLYALLQRDTAGVGGSLTATVSVAGTRAAPLAQGSFSLTDGMFGRFRTPFLDGTVTYGDRWLDGAVRLWRSGQEILSVTARLPVDLALQRVARRQRPDTLSVRVRADSVDLTLLEAVTPLVRNVRGGLNADFGIGGTWNAPRLSGRVGIIDAGAFIPAVNTRYEGIHGRFALSGDTILVESLTARGGVGRAAVTGAVRLEALTRPLLGLSIEAQEFTALDLRNFLTVTASGRLALAGPVFGAELTGRGTVTAGVWYFADLVRKRVVDIDAPWASTLIDTTLAATIRRQRLGPEFQSVFLDSLRIRDLDLVMGSDVWLRSNEANIQLTGTVRVSKTAGAYILTGTLQAPRGVYRLTMGPVTRDFTVTRGTVRYFGTPDLNAELDIEARHVVHPVPGLGGRPTEDVTVIAHIGGTLLVPRLTLQAEGRELAQTEIISYLLFGQPFEGDQSQLANQNALIRNALTSVYGELERTLVADLGVPLDYVEIRPSDPTAPLSGAQFAAGWQIGQKTFLVVKAGFCGGQTIEVSNAIGASLQFRISPEWRAEASFEPVLVCGGLGQQTSVRQTQQLGFDLFWERRY
jgi:autotransporter translocation and assembly factor TamB